MFADEVRCTIGIDRKTYYSYNGKRVSSTFAKEEGIPVGPCLTVYERKQLLYGNIANVRRDIGVLKGIIDELNSDIQYGNLQLIKKFF